MLTAAAGHPSRLSDLLQERAGALGPALFDVMPCYASMFLLQVKCPSWFWKCLSAHFCEVSLKRERQVGGVRSFQQLRSQLSASMKAAAFNATLAKMLDSNVEGS